MGSPFRRGGPNPVTGFRSVGALVAAAYVPPVIEAGFPVSADIPYATSTSMVGPSFTLGAGAHYVVAVVCWGRNGTGTLTGKSLTSPTIGTWTPLLAADTSGGPSADVGIEFYGAAVTGALAGEVPTFNFASADHAGSITVYAVLNGTGAGATVSAAQATNPEVALTPQATGSVLLVAGVGRAGGSSQTADANSTADHFYQSNGISLDSCFDHLSAVTSSTSAVTYGATGVALNNGLGTMAAGVEILIGSGAAATVIPPPLPISPMPVISRGVPAYASSQYDTAHAAGAANAGDYTAGWRSSPVNTWPQWLAYDMRAVPAASKQQVRFSWGNESQGEWYLNGDTGYGVPGVYTIDAHPSTSATVPADSDPGWFNLFSYSNTKYGSFTHDGSLTGFNWVRIRVTAGYPGNATNDVEMFFDIHDIGSFGNNADFGFVGDSIGTFAFIHDPTFIGDLSQWQPNTAYSDLTYKQVWVGTAPNLALYRLTTAGTSAAGGTPGHPAFEGNTGASITDGNCVWEYLYSTTRDIKDISQMVQAGRVNDFPLTVPHCHVGYSYGANGVAMVNQLLAASKCKFLCLGMGMNDASGSGFYTALSAVVDAALAGAGVQGVIIALPNWTNDATHNTTLQDPYTGAATAINPQIVKLRNDYRAKGKPVYDGPDLWTRFYNHPELIRNSTDIHPNPAGDKLLQELWADAILAVYAELDPRLPAPSIGPALRGSPNPISRFRSAQAQAPGVSGTSISLTGSGAFIIDGPAALAAALAMGGAAQFVLDAPGALSQAEALAASAIVVLGSAGTPSQAQAIGGSAALVVGESSSTAQTQAVGGAAPMVAGGSGVASQAQDLAGSASSVAGAVGTSAQSQALGGAGAVVVGGSGTSALAQALGGSAPAVVGGGGALSTAGALAFTGSAAVVVGGSGALAQSQPLGGSGAVAIGWQGSLAAALALAGSAPVATGGAGGLVEALSLVGSAALPTGGAGGLTEAQALAGAAAAVLGGAGTVSTTGALALIGTAQLVFGGSATAFVPVGIVAEQDASLSVALAQGSTPALIVAVQPATSAIAVKQDPTPSITAIQPAEPPVPTTFNFTGVYAVPIGNSKTIAITATRSDGVTPINLAGASFKFTLRNLPAETLAGLSKSFGAAYAGSSPSNFTITNAAQGQFTLNLVPADTKLLKPITYTHDLEITEADGTVSTILIGNFELDDHAARLN